MRVRQSIATVLVGKSILLREGLALILQSANFHVLASATCADDLLAGKFEVQQPLFLIVHTGHDFDHVLKQIELFRNQHPGGRIAIVADHYQLGDMVSAFRAGVNGFFVDATTCDEFIKSVELVMMGETIFPPAFLSYVLNPEERQLGETVLPDETNEAIVISSTEDTIAPQLSTREKSILRCLIDGDSNKSIARKINIAEATVKVHVKAILRKIRVQNRTQAAIWGMNNGSLAGQANDSSQLLISDMSKRLPKPVEVLSQIAQIKSPDPLAAIEHQPNHVDVPPIDGLLRKSISLKIKGATGQGK